MQGLADFIVDFLQLNEEIPFQTIGIGLLIYLFALWFVISIWVYFDALKRYDSQVTAFLFALLVLLLNFPMLIFYFAIRPDITFEDFDDWEAGGVNVPIVNFMGKQGIEMSFELRINPKKLRDTNKSPDMNIEIGWDKEDERFRLIDREELARQILEDEKPKRPIGSIKIHKKINNYFSQFAGGVKKTVTEVSSKVGKGVKKAQKKKDDVKDQETKKEEESIEVENKKKGKKKNRSKKKK